jgi:hypothetical protein
MTIESMESPLNVPPELLRQADTLLAVLIADAELLEIGRGYGLRLRVSPLLMVLLADRHGEAENRVAANVVESDY